MESLEYTAQQISGASADMEGFLVSSSVNQSVEHLPMVIYLRGDEQYFNEFSMDAEAAMQELGIKRSRLTQISGKELRVGRVRMDRYIRPMYRKIDIEEYKQWSRATATHQKSSSIIMEAAETLEGHAQTLTQTLINNLETFKSSLEQTFDKLTQDTQIFKDELVTNYNAQSEDIKARFLVLSTTHQQQIVSNFEQLSNHVDELITKTQILESTNSKIDTLQEVVAEVKEDIASMNLQSTTQSEKIAELSQLMTSNIRDIGKALGIIIQFQRDHSKKQDEMLLSLKTQKSKNIKSRKIIKRCVSKRKAKISKR